MLKISLESLFFMESDTVVKGFSADKKLLLTYRGLSSRRLFLEHLCKPRLLY